MVARVRVSMRTERLRQNGTKQVVSRLQKDEHCHRKPAGSISRLAVRERLPDAAISPDGSDELPRRLLPHLSLSKRDRARLSAGRRPAVSAATEKKKRRGGWDGSSGASPVRGAGLQQPSPALPLSGGISGARGQLGDEADGRRRAAVACPAGGGAGETSRHL